MVLDTALLNTQHYKVRIKGKVEQSGERSKISSAVRVRRTTESCELIYKKNGIPSYPFRAVSKRGYMSTFQSVGISARGTPQGYVAVICLWLPSDNSWSRGEEN